MDIPSTRYAHAGDDLIAYQTVGDAPIDLVFLLGWAHNVETVWELPAVARFFRRLASFCRLIIFDRRGTGLSDRGPGTFPLELAVEDIQAVMNDAASPEAAFFAVGSAARTAIMSAATHPDKTSALITFDGHPASFKDDDYPWGDTREAFAAQLESMEKGWGDPATHEMLFSLLAPSAMNDPAAKAWWRKTIHSGNRRDAMEMFRSIVEVDVRPLLPAVHVPTLIMHRSGDQMSNIGASRYMADRIQDARIVELAGADHFPFFGDQDEVIEEVEAFLTGARTAAEADRVLATVMFSDIVGSTERAASLGDRKWRDLLDAHDDLARKRVGEFKGRIVDHQGDGFLATFDGPARAIRCALSLRDGVRTLGLETRAGVHTGEVEVRGDNIGGIAVHIGARVAAKAGSGEVLVSRTVADLVVGSTLQFEDRGLHALKGVPGEWQLYAVKP